AIPASVCRRIVASPNLESFDVLVLVEPVAGLPGFHPAGSDRSAAVKAKPLIASIGGGETGYAVVFVPQVLHQPAIAPLRHVGRKQEGLKLIFGKLPLVDR